MALFHGGLFALVILCSLLTTDVVAGRVKPAALELSVTKHEQSADNRDGDQAWDDDWASCEKISADVRAIAAAGMFKNWEGVYKCLRTEGTSSNTIVFLECGKEGNTPLCWVKERADELQQFAHVAAQVAESIGASILGWLSGGDGKDSATVLANWLSQPMPAGPEPEKLTQAIQAFCKDTGDPEWVATLTSELTTAIKWDTRNPFEKTFIVAMLNSVPTPASLLQVSHSEAGELDQQGKGLGVAESSPGESVFTTLCRLIDAIFKRRNQAHAGRVQNRAMAQGIGWDHVWGELGKAGFKAGRR